MTQTPPTMKPVLALVENYPSRKELNETANSQSSLSDKSNPSMNASSTSPILSKRVMAHIWKRMVSIYGYKWASHLGDAMAGTDLSDSAKTWQSGLSGLTVEQIAHGFEALIFKNHEWPPSLPEFRKLCLLKGPGNVPPLDEIVAILVMGPSGGGSLAKRYKYSLALAISQQAGIDMHALRTARTVDARRMIKPVYDRLISEGWNDWPDHAHDEQGAIAFDKPEPNRAVARSALQGIRAAL